MFISTGHNHLSNIIKIIKVEALYRKKYLLSYK